MAFGGFNTQSTDFSVCDEYRRAGALNQDPFSPLPEWHPTYGRDPVFDPTCESPDIDWLGINKEFS